MPDFQFSEGNDAPTPTPPASSDNPPEKPTKFEFLSTDPAPVAPVAPPVPPSATPPVPAPVAAPPATPRPAPGVVPNPPLPPGIAPARPVNPAVPLPAASVPAAPVPAAPPTVPSPQIPGFAVPPVPPTTPTVPTAATPSAMPKPRPSSVPIPSPALPVPAMPIPSSAPAVEDVSALSAAPQDNFSFKIWSMGQSIKGVLDQMDGLASWVLRVALVVGVSALAYILAATLFGKAGNLTGNPNAASLIQNLKWASQALTISLLAGSVASLILGYEDNRLGAVVAALGLLLYVGAPLAIRNFVGISAATSPMGPLFRQTGYFLVMIGLLKALCDSAVWLWGLPDKVKTRHASVGVSNPAEAKQRIIAREANMTSPCWKLPFCRESIRKQCPAFLAKKTCWKFGRGCYCDEEMISRIVRGEALDVIKAPTRQSRQGKAPCERCYIYLEHQTYKFRMLSPLALPLTVLTSWLLWPIYSRVFTVLNGGLNSVWNSLSFNTAKLTPDAIKTTQESLDEMGRIGNNAAEFAYYAQNMFGLLLGFMLLIYLSKAIEWAIFKAKW